MWVKKKEGKAGLQLLGKYFMEWNGERKGKEWFQRRNTLAPVRVGSCLMSLPTDICSAYQPKSAFITKKRVEWGYQ